ncbi:hypothetical protein K788_00003320 [Paraburkholderia caribensis MBA4]|uniref:Uncharacterized protein n=1 Tax=Paraburkholderia caribensis MBA4 TaxID=1323664 RepID=A0A0P0RHS1_9BURK|nr:hypothetical protein K788_00003320 [Paraburkholderia caribensis MBA4]
MNQLSASEYQLRYRMSFELIFDDGMLCVDPGSHPVFLI